MCRQAKRREPDEKEAGVDGGQPDPRFTAWACLGRSGMRPTGRRGLAVVTDAQRLHVYAGGVARAAREGGARDPPREPWSIDMEGVREPLPSPA